MILSFCDVIWCCDCDCDISVLHDNCLTLSWYLGSSIFRIREKEKKRNKIKKVWVKNKKTLHKKLEWRKNKSTILASNTRLNDKDVIVVTIDWFTKIIRLRAITTVVSSKEITKIYRDNIWKIHRVPRKNLNLHYNL